MMSWVIHFDGCCEPINPGGTAAYGWTIHSEPDGLIVDSGSGVVGKGPGMTNNVAEWAALEAAVKAFVDAGLEGDLTIWGDSNLVINQLTGRWQCKKEHLAQARDRVLALLRGKEWKAAWIPREQNEEADALSKENLPTIPF